jgi:predicted translin family RNA/ssDNA-binding protein
MKFAIAIFLITAVSFADDSPLVKAAKANGGPKKSTKKVITNADVKKSSGKVTTLPVSTTTAPAAAVPKMSIADQDKLLHDRAAAQKRTDAAQAKVNDLDKELDRLEQAYYAENDPNYRDKTIAERFEQTKKQLDSARKELAEAREALEKLKPKISS